MERFWGGFSDGEVATDTEEPFEVALGWVLLIWGLAMAMARIEG